MRLDLRSLEIFIAVSEAGSMHRAATLVNAVPSAISKRISAMETSIGIALFSREPNGLKLTPAGDTLLQHARQSRRSIERTGAELTEHALGRRGRVQIYCNTTAMTLGLMQRISAFQSQNPLVKITVEERRSPEVADAVRNGNADIGLFSSFVDSRGLDMQPFGESPLVLVCRPDHPLAKAKKVKLEEIRRFDFVALGEQGYKDTLFTMLEQFSRQMNKDLVLKMHAASLVGLAKLILSHVGVTILPASSARLLTGDGALCIIPIDEAWAAVHINAVAARVDALAPAGRQLFMALVRTDDIARPGSLAAQGA